MPILPFMGNAPPGQQDDEKIVSDLIGGLQSNLGPEPTSRKVPPGQAILGALSDAMRTRATVMAGGLPGQGAFAQQLQQMREQDEADRRDYLKARRDIEARIRIGVAEGKLRETADIRTEERGERIAIREEDRAAKREAEKRRQDLDDALNRELIQRGAVDEVAGDFRQMPFEERAKLLSKSMGSRSPAEAYEQFISSGLSGSFRVQRIEAFSDGTFAPVLEPIEEQKKAEVARNQKLIEDLAAAGVPRDQVIERARAIGIDDEVASVLGDLSDNVVYDKTLKAKVQVLDDLANLIVEDDPDLAADIATLRGLVESDATMEDAATVYADMVEGARALIAEYEKNPATGASPDVMARHLQKMRTLFRQHLGYEMPDVSLLPQRVEVSDEPERESKRDDLGRTVRRALRGMKMLPEKKPAKLVGQ